MFYSNIPVNYIQLDKNLKPYVSELSVSELYNIGERELDDLYFAFESKFDPYQQFVYEKIDNIDLVIKGMDGAFLRPLEVKLTVIPDSATYKSTDESTWGSEIVIRSATTQYCALGMAYSLQNEMQEIRSMFEGPCSRIQDWANKTEVRTRLPGLIDLCDLFEKKYYNKQQPLIMQPIWKTKGQDPLLVEHNTFDIFVWSDFAFSRLFLSSPLEDIEQSKPLSRQNRATARFVRFWYELARNGCVHINDIYRQMTFDHQTDKEFSANGYITNPYMACPRLTKPRVDRDALYDIILDRGEELLMPERRLDQSVLYFTMRNPRPTGTSNINNALSYAQSSLNEQTKVAEPHFDYEQFEDL